MVEENERTHHFCGAGAAGNQDVAVRQQDHGLAFKAGTNGRRQKRPFAAGDTVNFRRIAVASAGGQAAGHQDVATFENNGSMICPGHIHCRQCREDPGRGIERFDRSLGNSTAVCTAGNQNPFVGQLNRGRASAGLGHLPRRGPRVR